MMLRFSLPCNLARVMEVTGLSSAGASILVNKLVNFDCLVRHDDPQDRRNVIINFTPKGAEMCRSVEDRLNKYIFSYFENCDEQELQEIENASRIVCRALDGMF
jgi:DNA-binding MarR family transcriptional regulator